MHNYLRAAGFSEYNTEGIVYRFIRNSVIKPEYLTARLDLGDGSVLLEYRQPVNAFAGICAAVIISNGEFTEIQYYYPYFNGPEISTEAVCTVEKHTITDTYSGVIDDYTIGLSLIFFMSNPVSYRLRRLNDSTSEFRGTALSAFANEATVLLPVVPQEENKDFKELDLMNAHEVVNAILNPEEHFAVPEDEEPEYDDSLLDAEIDMYNQITERIESEDLYSLVAQSFMPCGVECDQYSVIGEILDYAEHVNELTEENLAFIKLSCNDVEFWLCMRKDDILGEPKIGRRLKCRIWLTGVVNV